MEIAIKNALARTQEFVSEHKTAIAVGVTLAVCVAVHLKIIGNTNDRLREMGVFDEFWKTTV